MIFRTAPAVLLRSDESSGASSKRGNRTTRRLIEREAEMSVSGTKRSSQLRCRMSAIGGKADIASSKRHVRF
jgi:hypothetical protein